MHCEPPAQEGAVGNFTESVIEDAALDWLRDDLGYAVLHGNAIASDAPLSERAGFADEVLEHPEVICRVG